MSERIGIQDIIEALAKKNGIDKKNAEAFVKEIFNLIEEGLKLDQYVKIKGLGTFKLIDVNSRESVNVNTGERFEIEGHKKVSFTPDANIKDLINKPFAHFETVILNEDTILDDTPVIEELEEEQDLDNEIEPSITTTEEKTIIVHNNEEIKPNDNTIQTSSKKNLGSFIAIVTILLFVFCATLLYIYKPNVISNWLPKSQRNITKSKITSPNDTTLLEQTVKGIQEKEIKIDTTQTIITGVRKGFNNVVTDSTSYIIIGTMDTYKLGAGETLTMVSKRFYETKDLWPYILKHNRDVIKNPNRVPSGIILKIPTLKDK